MARILIADDDSDIRHLLVYSLVDEGHEVSMAKDGLATLDALRPVLPDLLILDVMMPGKDGFEVLEEMNAAGARDTTRVLMLTAKSSDRDFERGLQLGADAYMTKPFDPDEIVRTVRDLLALTNEELRQRRDHELDKSRILSQLESIFGEE